MFQAWYLYNKIEKEKNTKCVLDLAKNITEMALIFYFSWTIAVFTAEHFTMRLTCCLRDTRNYIQVIFHSIVNKHVFLRFVNYIIVSVSMTRLILMRNFQEIVNLLYWAQLLSRRKSIIVIKSYFSSSIVGSYSYVYTYVTSATETRRSVLKIAIGI